MDIPQKVRAAERALKTAGISVRQFCFRAEIHPMSWRHWREGVNRPQLTKWLQVEATLEAIRKEGRQAEARKRAAKKAAKERAMTKAMTKAFLEAAERALKPQP